MAPQAMEERGRIHRWLDVSRIEVVFGGSRQRSGYLFVLAAPPRRCPLLFYVCGHRRAAVMGASDDESDERLLVTTERVLKQRR